MQKVKKYAFVVEIMVTSPFGKEKQARVAKKIEEYAYCFLENGTNVRVDDVKCKPIDAIQVKEMTC